MQKNRWKIIGSISAMSIAIICIIVGVVILCDEESEELYDESVGKTTINETASNEDNSNDETYVQEGELINSQPAKVNFFDLESDEAKLYVCEQNEGIACKQLEIDEWQGYALEDKEVREIAWLFQSQPFLNISEEMSYHYDVVIAFFKGEEKQYMAIERDTREAYYNIEVEGVIKTYRVFLREAQAVYIEHIIENHMN